MSPRRKEDSRWDDPARTQAAKDEAIDHLERGTYTFSIDVSRMNKPERDKIRYTVNGWFRRHQWRGVVRYDRHAETLVITKLNQKRPLDEIYVDLRQIYADLDEVNQRIGMISQDEEVQAYIQAMKAATARLKTYPLKDLAKVRVELSVAASQLLDAVAKLIPDEPETRVYIETKEEGM